MHLHDFALADIQAIGKKLRIGNEPLVFKLSSFLVEVVEQFALVLGGPDLHQPVIVEQVAKNIGADPPGGVGIKAHALRCVKLPDRLHQADISLLNEVELVGS